MTQARGAALCLALATIATSFQSTAQVSGSGAQYQINREDLRRQVPAEPERSLELEAPPERPPEAVIQGSAMVAEHFAV